MAIEIVDLPSYNMVIFHSYVIVYQKVTIRTEKMMVSKGSHAQATFQLVVNYHELFR